MKKILHTLSLAAAAILLLGSCAKINERIDDLEGRINGLEKESIATINTQITSITSSIADLGTIRTNIQNLTATTAAQAQDIKDLNNEDTEIGKKISDLKKADESIGSRIDALQKYVKDTLKVYATTEWVKATFSTLAQYEETCDTIAKIDARIGALDSRLSQSIEDCADSLKAWVNVQLDGYYTIAQMDAKVAEMNAQIDTLKSENEAKADSLKAEIAATKAELDTVKANIRTEYKAAIETAITELDGKLSAALEAEIIKVNNELFYLNDRISSLASYVLNLAGKVTALETMIQSVVIVPAYSDGSVLAMDSVLVINFIVSPADAVESLKMDSVKILLNTVLTKAVNVDTVQTEKITDFNIDKTKGIVAIKADIKDQLKTLQAGKALTVAVNVKNGISKYTTEFVPVNEFTTTFVDLGITNSDGKSVLWATCNLGATKPEDPGDYYMWGATALIYSAVDYTKTDGAFTFVTSNPYGDNYKNTWDANKGFEWNNIPFAEGVFKDNEGERNVFTKYTKDAKFAKSDSPDNITTLKPEDDAANAKNSSWRIPTKGDFEALRANCVWVWTTGYNDTGKAGYIVYKVNNEEDKGKAYMNGAWKKWNGSESTYDNYSSTPPSGYTISEPHIFLPAAGNVNGTKLTNLGSTGNYLSSSLDEAKNEKAFAVIINKSIILITNTYRNYGCTIRPVTELKTDN